jgi:DNA-binding NtrC family response regulator
MRDQTGYNETAKAFMTPGSRSPTSPDPAAGDRAPEPLVARVVLGNDVLFEITLTPGRAYSIGRAGHDDLQVEDMAVSRHHGVLRCSDRQGWCYVDGLSTNGTHLETTSGHAMRLNGASTKVYAGDTLCLGSARCTITFLTETSVKPRDGSQQVSSRAARQLEADIKRVAGTGSIVLVQGPSGSGKTFTAERIHELSGRKGPFVAVNCAGLPKDPTQLHAYFLGAVRGAYTGLAQTVTGVVFNADGGTLFLDEVDSTPAEGQNVLLDILERKGLFAPLGDPRQRTPPDFRVIAAIKRPLTETTLRRDLGHRLLSGTRLEMPRLKDRAEDVPVLMDRFAREVAKNAGLTATVTFTEEAVKFCQDADWLGEVRQLQSAVSNATLEALEMAGRGGDVVVGDVFLRRARESYIRGFGLSEATQTQELKIPIVLRRPADLTAEQFHEVLDDHDWNLTRTAKAMNIAVNTLKSHMERLGLRKGNK